MAAGLLTSDPRVQAVSFVGSSAVAFGTYLYHRQRPWQTRTGLRGRQNPRNRHARMLQIWTPPSTPLWAGIWFRGRTLCMALPVVVAVGDETADRLIERLKPLIAALRIGRESCAAR